MDRPFVAENCVIFECQSGRLLVGDLANRAAEYRIPTPGICHLPGEAIMACEAGAEGAFSVDSGQLFLVDADSYEAVREEVLAAGPEIFDDRCRRSLRRKHQTAFGHLRGGELYDCDFSCGDGTYRLDLSKLGTGVPAGREEKSPDAKELLRRTIVRMNTLVCAKCCSAEYRPPQDLRDWPKGRDAKIRWATRVAELAMADGWTAAVEKGSFGDIMPVCPSCRGKGR